MNRYLFCLLLLAPLLQGCGLQEREDAIRRKEEALLMREQTLLQKASELALKEKDLQKLELQLQQQLSTSLADTLPPDTTRYHQEVLGQWTTVMTCTETSCPGSAIGDTKTETWVFSYEQDHLVAKAMAGDKVTRIYTGRNTDTQVIELTATVEATNAVPATKIVVRLNPTDRRTMDGQRHIIREGGCTIMYSLKLTRQ